MLQEDSGDGVDRTFAVVMLPSVIEDVAPSDGIDQTFAVVKPDGVRRHLTSEVLARFTAAGLTPSQLAVGCPDRSLVAQHYRDAQDEPFFNDLLEYLAGELVVAAVLVGDDAVTTGREIVGDSDPAEAAPGTIRGDLGQDSVEQADQEQRAVRNVVHAADSPEAAEREISLWIPGDVSSPVPSAPRPSSPSVADQSQPQTGQE